VSRIRTIIDKINPATKLSGTYKIINNMGRMLQAVNTALR